MDQGSFLKEQEKTKSELSFSLIESKAKEIFTAHEAACLWVELWDESPLAIKYSLHCDDIKKARRLATLNNADGFTKYVVIRSAIDSKILANSGTFGTSTTITDWNKASDELKDRGCMRCLSSKDNLINTKLLKEIANSISEKPAFLFPSSSPSKKSTIDPRKETTLNCLIAVLAKKLNYSPDSSDTVGKVHALLEYEGVHMDKKTIRANIKEAFSSLNEKRE